MYGLAGQRQKITEFVWGNRHLTDIVNIKPKFTKLSRLAKFDLLSQKMMPIFASFLLN